MGAGKHDGGDIGGNTFIPKFTVALVRHGSKVIAGWRRRSRMRSSSILGRGWSRSGSRRRATRKRGIVDRERRGRRDAVNRDRRARGKRDTADGAVAAVRDRRAPRTPKHGA